MPAESLYENSQHDEQGWHPMIVTDSKCLSEWEHLRMTASVNGTESGVFVRIYRNLDQGS